MAALAPAVEAVALSQLGDVSGSEHSIRRARGAFDAVDAATGTVFGFSEQRLAFYEARARSELATAGAAPVDTAFAAQERAIAAYPPDSIGDPTLTTLDRAVCLAVAGDAAGGCELAHQVLAAMPNEHRAPIFTRHAERVALAAGDTGRELLQWLGQSSLR